MNERLIFFVVIAQKSYENCLETESNLDCLIIVSYKGY